MSWPKQDLDGRGKEMKKTGRVKSGSRGADIRDEVTTSTSNKGEKRRLSWSRRAA